MGRVVSSGQAKRTYVQARESLGDLTRRLKEEKRKLKNMSDRADNFQIQQSLVRSLERQREDALVDVDIKSDQFEKLRNVKAEVEANVRKKAIEKAKLLLKSNIQKKLKTDSELVRQRQVLKQLKPGTFAHRETQEKIDRREAEISGGTFIPSKVVIAKGDIGFEERKIAATAKRQREAAAVFKKTQEALFKKFDLEGQLRREARDRVSSDVGKGNLGVIDVEKGTNRRITPFEAQSIRKQFKIEGLATFPRKEGKALSAQELSKEIKGEKKTIVFSPSTGQVVSIRDKPKKVKRPKPEKVAVFVSRQRLKKIADTDVDAARELIQKTTIGSLNKAAAQNRILDAVLNLTGKTIEAVASKTARDESRRVYDALTGKSRFTRGTDLANRVSVAGAFFDEAVQGIQKDILKKMGVEKQIKLRDIADIRKLTTKAVTTAGLGILANGAIVGKSIAVDLVNAFSKDFAKKLDFKSPIAPLADPKFYKDLGVNALQAFNPTTFEGLGNIIIGVGALSLSPSLRLSSVAGTTTKTTAKGSVNSILKGLQKPKTSNVKLTKKGRKIQVELTGNAKFKGKNVPVKQRNLVNKVNPSDLRWRSFSDYKVIDSTIKNVISGSRAVRGAPSRLVKKGLGVTSRVKAKVKAVATRVQTKKEIFFVEGEVFVRTVPVAERIYLNKPIALLDEVIIKRVKKKAAEVAKVTKEIKKKTKRVARRVRVKKEIFVVDGETIVRNVPLTERFFLKKPIGLVKEKVKVIGGKVTKNVKKLLNVISEIRRKKILKLRKESPSLADNLIIERVSLLEQAATRADLIRKQLLKNSSVTKTARTPFRVILPGVGNRFVTPKLFRRFKNYQRFIIDEFGDSIGNTISDNFKRAGVALKRFDSNFEKLILDLDKGVVIAKNNQALLALKRLSKGPSKSARKTLRKKFLKQIKEVENKVDVRELALKRIEQKKAIALAAKKIPLKRLLKQDKNIKSILTKYEKNPRLKCGKGACEFAAQELARELVKKGQSPRNLKIQKIRTVANDGKSSNHIVLKVGKKWLDPTGTQYVFNAGRKSSILNKLPKQYKRAGTVNIDIFLKRKITPGRDVVVKPTEAARAALGIIRKEVKVSNKRINLFKRKTRGAFKDNTVAQGSLSEQVVILRPPRKVPVKLLRRKEVPRFKLKKKPVKPKVKKVKQVGKPVRKVPPKVITKVKAPKINPRLLVPILFSKLEEATKQDRQSLILNNAVSLVGKEKIKTDVRLRLRKLPLQVQPTRLKSPLPSDILPFVFTAQGVSVTSLMLSRGALLNQMIPLATRKRFLRDFRLSEGSRFLRSIHTSRLSNVNFSYVADLYAVLYGQRASKKEKKELTRPGKVFTGLEARKLIGNKK